MQFDVPQPESPVQDAAQPSITDVGTGADVPVMPTGDPVVAPQVPSQKSFLRPVFLLPIIAILVASAGAAYYFTSAKAPKATQIAVQPTPTQTQQEQYISLEHPVEGDSAVDGEILVSGKTLPGSSVMIFSGSDEVIAEIDASGTFAQTILLDSGVNTVTVTSFGPDGQETSTSVEVQES